MISFTVEPKGPYDLIDQNGYFGSFPTLVDGTIVVACPLEGSDSSVAVTISQHSDNTLTLQVYGDDERAEQARDQVLATLSLDIDGGQWTAVGKADAHIGELQLKYKFLRPVLFCSPYEAAVHFIIGHRISMKQGRAIRAKIAETHGEKIEVEGESFAAFPAPKVLLKIAEFPGLNTTKIERLHGVAQAALDGKLDRARLRQLAPEEAQAQLLGLDGVGPFFASGIVHRGVGVVDELTDDDLTKYAVQTAYDLPESPKQAEVLKIADNWKPYRMWAEVLLHVWLRREIGLPRRRP